MFETYDVRKPKLIHLALTASLFTTTLVTQSTCYSQGDDGASTFTKAERPPVRRIVLFNSGIAQIVHQGKMNGNQLIEIDFDRDQVDDVLKSVVFDDKSGSVESVQYHPAPGKESLAAKRLGPPKTIAETLQSYRGESVSLVTKQRTIQGNVLGVENRITGKETRELITLVTSQGIQSIPLGDVETFRFDSKKVNEEIQLAMTGLLQQRDVEKETLSIFFEGEGERDVQFGYVVDAPIWRMSYRLDVGKKKSTLQGWAHVDNASGFDWKNVYVDLKSGRPQTFALDMFNRVIGTRPFRDLSIFGIVDGVQITQDFGTMGQQNFFEDIKPKDAGYSAGGSYGYGMRGGFGGGGAGGGGMGGGGFFGGSSKEIAKEARREIKIGDSFEVSALQGKAARMLEFKIEKPINLATGHSAMFPILKQESKTELLTVFDATAQQLRPILAVRLTNDTKFPLGAGPISVFQSGGFIGDSEIKRSDIDDESLLAYGEDQSLSLSVEDISTELIYEEVRLARENLILNVVVDRTSRETRKYLFANKDTEARKIRFILDPGSAKLSPTPVKNKPGESHTAYEFKLAANSDIEKEIVMDTPNPEVIRFTDVTPELFQKWKAAKVKIEGNTGAKLDKYFKLRAASLKSLAAVAKASQAVSNNESEQRRLSQLITAMKTEADAKQYVVQLTKLNEGLFGLRKELSQAIVRRDKDKQALAIEIQ